MSMLSRNNRLAGGLASDLPDALNFDLRESFFKDSVTSNISIATI